ncbi:golgin subfamily B member 1-like [Senna tora]|uniref:Golgin subfamily B member 1-like n=1 Tax=Senna tora TaxID=362788 RepID=A0A834XEP2_9FABA|nr:golgin subfamily B member 1-like [Senna tora]
MSSKFCRLLRFILHPFSALPSLSTFSSIVVLAETLLPSASADHVAPASSSSTQVKDSDECQAPPDPFIFSKGLIGNLRETLTKCKLDVHIAGSLLKDEQDGRKFGEAKYRELQDQFEALNQHYFNLEASNIELAVQNEATKILLEDIQGWGNG